jgi:hypothetical protein
MFRMGKRELEEKFTKSELVILGWRSQETSAQLEKQTKEVTDDFEASKKRQPRQHPGNAEMPANLPEHFFNENGEVDLRKVSGEEAYRYFSSIGVHLPIITGNRG